MDEESIVRLKFVELIVSYAKENSEHASSELKVHIPILIKLEFM